MLGGMLGGRNGAMVGGLLGSLLGGRQLGRLARSVTGGIGGIGGRGDDADAGAGSVAGGGGGSAFDGGQPPPPQGSQAELTDADAQLLVRMMCNAAKADGEVDADEASRIANQLGDEVTDAERAFLSTELHSPFVLANELAATVPGDLAAEAYAVSMMAIDVDTMAENQYLTDLAGGLHLSPQDRAEIHAELGLG